MDSLSPSSHVSSGSALTTFSRDGSPYPLPSIGTSRRTAHARDRGGLMYGMGVAWTHLRPFLPFFLISFLVVALLYLLRVIVYSGPFTDPLFFQKFDQRWPKPSLDKGQDPHDSHDPQQGQPDLMEPDGNITQ